MVQDHVTLSLFLKATQIRNASSYKLTEIRRVHVLLCNLSYSATTDRNVSGITTYCDDQRISTLKCLN